MAEVYVFPTLHIVTFIYTYMFELGLLLGRSYCENYFTVGPSSPKYSVYNLGWMRERKKNTNEKQENSITEIKD